MKRFAVCLALLLPVLAAAEEAEPPRWFLDPPQREGYVNEEAVGNTPATALAAVLGYLLEGKEVVVRSETTTDTASGRSFTTSRQVGEMALGQVRVRLDKRSSEEGAGGSATLLQRVEVLFERGPGRVRINLEQELLTRGGEPLDRTVTSLRTADLAFGALLEHLEEKGVRFRWMVTPSTSYLQLHVPEDLLYGS